MLVVLLSAVPTEAQPRSRTVGSAFDPATHSVALGQKRDDQVKAASANEARDPGLHVSGCSGDLLAVDAESAACVLPFATMAFPIARASAAWHRNYPTNGPRAPPLR